MYGGGGGVGGGDPNLTAPQEDARKKDAGKEKMKEKGTADGGRRIGKKRQIEAQTNYMATKMESIVDFGLI